MKAWELSVPILVLGELSVPILVLGELSVPILVLEDVQRYNQAHREGMEPPT
jgi:hypothetical protein